MPASTRVNGRSWEWWPGVGDLRLMGTRETSHRAEPHRCSHRLLSDASPSRQLAERGVNSPQFDAEVRTVFVDPGAEAGRAELEGHGVNRQFFFPPAKSQAGDSYAINPSSFCRGGTLVTSRSVFLHRGHAKLVRLLRASATSKPLRVNLSQRQRATPRVTYFRLGFSRLEPGSTEHAVR